MNLSSDVNYLRLQCRRGMLELDEILLNFFNLHYKDLSSFEQQQFSYLLQQEDADLFNWLFNKSIPSDPNLKNLILLIKNTITKP